MKRTMSGLVVLLLFLCPDISAHAQGIEWETLNDEVMSLYSQGCYDRAVVVAKKALQVAEQAVGPNHPSWLRASRSCTASKASTPSSNARWRLGRRLSALISPMWPRSLRVWRSYIKKLAEKRKQRHYRRARQPFEQ